MQEGYNFKHYISLGYFCSVALELEKCGLRSQSSPFDWNITWSFKGVIEAINNRFEDALNEQMLFQEKGCSEHYRSQRYLMDYYHDFDGYHSLEEQIAEVRAKYNRRIENFYKSISQPTLFIRYVCPEGGAHEIKWIENNIDFVMDSLKSFNNENDIMFITSFKMEIPNISIFHVDVDKKDYVARRFTETDPTLNHLFNAFILEEKERNIRVYHNKMQVKRKQNRPLHKITNYLQQKSDERFRKKYIHEKLFLPEETTDTVLKFEQE